MDGHSEESFFGVKSSYWVVYVALLVGLYYGIIETIKHFS